MADISKIQLENTLYDIKDKIAREQIANIGNKKILFIGDSYLEMYNGTSGIIDKFKTITGITNVIYSVYSGTGFAYTVDSKNFNTLLNSVTSDNDVTDIIVIGGYNDQYSNQGDVLTAIGTFCTNAKTKFPNAQVYIGMAGFTMESSKRYPIYTTYVTYSKCNQFGAIYLNGVECVMHDTSLFLGGNDLTHPNETGRFELATAISQAWKNGYYQMTRSFNSVPLELSGSASSGTFEIDAMIMNNTTHIVNVTNRTIYFSSHPSYSDIHDVDIELATLTLGSSNAIISPWAYNMYPIPVTCAVHDTNGYRTMNGKIQLVNNKIYLKLEDVEHNNWTDIEDLEDIEINAFQSSFPTQMI